MGFSWDVRRGDPDFPALVVAVSALGEHRQGAAFRLFEELREIRGLNYGDYAYPEHFVQAPGGALPAVNHPRSYQEFTVWIRPVEPQHRLFAIRAALYEIDRWAKQGLSQEELDRVKQFLAGYTLTFDQTDARKLGYALDDRFYGLERPWLETLRARDRRAEARRGERGPAAPCGSGPAPRRRRDPRRGRAGSPAAERRPLAHRLRRAEAAGGAGGRRGHRELPARNRRPGGREGGEGGGAVREMSSLRRGTRLSRSSGRERGRAAQ